MSKFEIFHLIMLAICGAFGLWLGLSADVQGRRADRLIKQIRARLNL